jgi:hypothetical protein
VQWLVFLPALCVVAWIAYMWLNIPEGRRDDESL